MHDDTCRNDRAGGNDDLERRAELIRVIEGEILPRLLLLCRSVPARELQKSCPGADDVDEFARLLVVHGTQVALEFIEAVRRSGVPYPLIYTGLLAPAARHLVHRWERHDFGYPVLASSLHALQSMVSDIGRQEKSGRSAFVSD